MDESWDGKQSHLARNYTTTARPAGDQSSAAAEPRNVVFLMGCLCCPVPKGKRQKLSKTIEHVRNGRSAAIRDKEEAGPRVEYKRTSPDKYGQPYLSEWQHYYIQDI